MNRIAKTDDLFKNGLSCSQAILAGFGDAANLHHDQAIRLTRAFGMGLRRRAFCGAVTASAMLLGFKVRVAENERAARYAVHDLFQVFSDRFEVEHGSILCQDLLNGIDLSTDDGVRRAQEEQVFSRICPNFVHTAAVILNDLL